MIVSHRTTLKLLSLLASIVTASAVVSAAGGGHTGPPLRPQPGMSATDAVTLARTP